MAYLSSSDFTGSVSHLTWWNRIRMNLFLSACGEAPSSFLYFTDKANLAQDEFNKKWGHLQQDSSTEDFKALQERLSRNERLFNQFYKGSADSGTFKDVNVLAACFKAGFADTGWGRLRWAYKWLTVPLTLVTELAVSAVSETFLSINIGLNNLKPSGEGMFGAALLNVWKAAKGFMWVVGEIVDAISDVFRPTFWTHDNLIHPSELHSRSTIRISSVSEDVDYAFTTVKSGFDNLFKKEKKAAPVQQESTSQSTKSLTPFWNMQKELTLGSTKPSVEIEMKELPTQKLR